MSPASPSGPRRAVGLVVLAALVGGLLLARLLLYRGLDGALVVGWPEPDLRGYRLVAAGLAVGAGAALAAAGLALQALLRNVLAAPSILGVTSGAALGVMVALYLGHRAGTSGPLLPGGTLVPAALGATGALLVVGLLGRRRGAVDPLSLLLVGVIVSAMCASLVLLLQHLVPRGLRADLLSWMTGSIDEGAAPARVWSLLAAAAVGTVALRLLAGGLDALALGDEVARSVGARVARLRWTLFGVAGLLTAWAVAVTGPIGFVGLVGPHVARRCVGPGHRTLVLASALAGAALLLAADVASQLLRVDGGRLPVGVFTALVGGPSFIVLLRRGRGTGAAT